MSLAERQLELLRRMAALDPPPCIFGGYAEDALLAGTVTRPHADVDWLCRRSELKLRRAQAESLGFSGFETMGEAAPGVPFYLFARGPDALALDVGIVDEEHGELWVRVHRLAFTVGGREAPAGYRFRMPGDTFAHPPVALDGISLHVASPLALYRLRVSIAGQGSFGELSERHRETSRRLRERFLAGLTEHELVPPVEALA